MQQKCGKVPFIKELRAILVCQGMQPIRPTTIATDVIFQHWTDSVQTYHVTLYLPKVHILPRFFIILTRNGILNLMDVYGFVDWSRWLEDTRGKHTWAPQDPIFGRTEDTNSSCHAPRQQGIMFLL